MFLPVSTLLSCKIVGEGFNSDGYGLIYVEWEGEEIASPSPTEAASWLASPRGE